MGNPTVPVRLRKGLGIFLALVGATGFLAGFYLASGADQAALRSVELPLSDIQDMAVDSQGRTYLASAFYSRIQRYDAQGRFQLGWAAQSEGGPLTVALKGNDTIVSEAERRGSLLLFDLDGHLLAERPSTTPTSWPMGESVTAERPDGSHLFLRRGTLSSTIVRDSAGVIAPLIVGPRSLRYLGGFPAFLLFAAGMVLYWGGFPTRMRQSAAT